MSGVVLVATVAFICGLVSGITLSQARILPVSANADSVRAIDVNDLQRGCVIYMDGTQYLRTRNDCLIIARAIFQQMQVEP